MSDQNQIPLFSIPVAKADQTDSFDEQTVLANDKSLQLPAMGSGTTVFASVIIPLALPTTYTYTVPAIFAKVIQLGCRVEVGLGRNKKYAGIVKSISGIAPSYPTKEILNVLDDTPLLYV
jgi:3'DNA-binding domain (3'BD)